MNNQRKDDQYEAQAEQYAAAAAEDGDVVNQADAIADTNLGSKQNSASDDQYQAQADAFAAAAAEDGDVVNEDEAKADTNLGQ